VIISSKFKHSFLVYLIITASWFFVPAGNDPAYAQERMGEVLKSLEMDQKMAAPPKVPQAPPTIQKEPLPQVRVKAPAGKKIAVKKIVVDGYNLIQKEEVDSITVPNEGKNLDLEELGMIAEIITAKYREKGYIISFAYLPPQEVKDGVVHFRVVEGKVGDIQVTREKSTGYFSFSDAFIKRYIRTVLSDPSLREDALERALMLLNDYNGLTAKTMLKRGKTPGSTDIVTNVTEKYPWAASLFYDNFGSSTTGKHRLGLGLDFGNLATSGDLLLLRGVTGLDKIDINALSYGRVDYLVPLAGWGTKGGVYYTNSLYTAGQDLSILDIQGKANIAGLYFTHPLLKKRNEELSIKIGFDYKNINEYLLGNTRSTDSIRVVGASLSYDFLDRFLGKNVITPGFYQGIPGFMGGSRNGDPNLSITGAQANFKKATLDIMRIQKLPGYNYLILRGNGQWSPDVLFVAEQYIIGGMGTVRGYQPSAAVGDKGYTASAELVISPFFPEATIFNHKFGDIFKLAAFIDHGEVVKNNPVAGDIQSDYLNGIGGGFRIYWGRNFTFRFDLAVPRSDSGNFNYQNNICYLQMVMSF